MEIIGFYNPDEAYGYLSNYYPASFELDGQTWASTEHYYQAQKTLDSDYREKVRLAPTSDDAKKMGKPDQCTVRADWECHKDVAMAKALRAKFTQNADLKLLLLATGDAALFENSPRDLYWGVGLDFKGQNKLGKLLMALRQELADE